MMPNRTFLKFQDTRLSSYNFSLSHPEDTERYFGVDNQLNIWRGSKLADLNREGKISKTLPEKDIIIRETGALLGYVRECPDSTFLAHSCYFSGAFDWVEVNGFREEFYAIIYLHEILIKTFPRDIYPAPPNKNISNLTSNSADAKGIYIQELDAKVGCIQQVSDSLWMANSFYHPQNMSGLKVVGFLNEFYASRYLFQVAEVFFPDAVNDIPELPWKYMNGENT
jgi:hypothetical protein